MLIILFIAPFIRSETITYSEETYVEWDSSKSPATLSLKGHLSIMLVEWPDSFITINSKKLSNLDGYSLFTFSNDATVILEFPKKISFFIYKYPNLDSFPASFISNLQTNEIQGTNFEFDYYFSVFGKYNIQGNVQFTGNDGSFISSMDNKTFSNQDLNVKGIEYTSSLVRTSSSDKLTLSKLEIKTEKNINPTIPTSIKFRNSDNLEGFNHFGFNYAYGGINQINKSIINNILPKEVCYLCKVINKMTKDIKIEYNIDSESDYHDYDINLYLVRPVTVHFYLRCENELFKVKTVNVTSYSNCNDEPPENQTVTITDDDIPSQCYLYTHSILIKNELSTKTDAELYYKIKGENKYNIINKGTQSEQISRKSDQQPSLDLYIKTGSSACNTYNENAKIGTYKLERYPSKTYIIDDSKINKVCLPYSICTEIDGIPSDIKIGYRYKGQADITEINDQLKLQNYEESFDVEIILIQSAYCNQKNLVLKTITSSQTIDCKSIITIDLITEECRPSNKPDVTPDDSSIDITTVITEQLPIPPATKPPVTNEQKDYSTSEFDKGDDGETIINIADDKYDKDVQHNINVEQDVESITVDTDKKLVSLILPEEIESITINAAEGKGIQEFDIIPKADVTLILDENTKVSIQEAKATVTVKNNNDNKNLAMKQISPQSKDFKFISEVSVNIDEIDFSDGDQGMNVETTKDSVKISVEKVKIQPYSSGTISNVSIKNIVFAPSSSLIISSNVNLEESDIDISLNNKISSQKAPMNGELNSVPKRIVLNTRDIQYLANDDSFLLAESKSDKFDCEEWARRFNEPFNTKFNDAKCITEENADKESVKRLYATVNDNKNKGKEDNGNGLSGGAIAGIVIACIVVVAVIIVLVYFLIIKKKGDKPSEQEEVEV